MKVSYYAEIFYNHNNIQLWDFEYGQKPYYEAKYLFSRGHFVSLEYCHTYAHPKTFNH